MFYKDVLCTLLVKPDLNESFVIGSKAIDKALENVSGHVMGFKRLSNHPYESIIFLLM